MTDMNAEPRTVDEQMDRSIRGEPAKLNIPELLQAPRQRGVIRNREIQVEQLGKATEEALGLAKRKVEDHADRQRGLDRNVRVPALTSGLAAGRSSPGVERNIRELDGQVATPLEARVILRPIP